MNTVAGWILFLLLLPAGSQAPATSPAQPEVAEEPAWVELKGGLRYRDLVVGEGAEARSGSLLQVHYTGWLAEGGDPFDSSRTSGRAFVFALGSGAVVAGWEKGLVGMQVGGKRELQIPAKMGYGKRGVPGRIPPDSELRFEIELLTVSAAPR
ncbi:MAG TPA: FKBP-type peptidyl-prolyl cis-trans isomerase [Thermoanaerobaculia bacterium]|nr:FKBP-type peptidyl-prolyl cis-trans isomerase [Thermoanaerobaculia bacterium]